MLAGLASGTKFTGIFIFPALVFEYLLQKDFSFKNIKLDFLWLSLAPTGLLIYMYYLWQKTGDWLYFLHTQTTWKRSISIINPLDVLIDYWQKIVFVFTKNDNMFILLSTEFFLTILFLALSFMIYQKVSKSLGLYSFLVTIFPILTGTLVSMPRYVLVAFPGFILL